MSASTLQGDKQAAEPSAQADPHISESEEAKKSSSVVTSQVDTQATEPSAQDDPHVSEFEEAKKSSVVTSQVDTQAAEPLSQDDPHISESEGAKKSSSVVTSKVDTQSPPAASVEQGPEEIEGLYWDEDKLDNAVSSYLALFKYARFPRDEEDYCSDDENQYKKIMEQIALHRIRAHEILNGVKLEELNDTELIKDCTPKDLEDMGYYKHFEAHFEWYFDPKYCNQLDLQDYQRLVLRNDGRYLDWEYYHGTRATYEGDLEYIRFYENMSSKTKWLLKFFGVPSSEWRNYEYVAYYHAVKDAASYPNVLRRLVSSGFEDYIDSLLYDNVMCKEKATLFFELWKRVAKGKMGFIEALEQVSELPLCASSIFDIRKELSCQPEPGWLRDKYETYISGIDGEVKEDEAHSLILEAVKTFLAVRKRYYDYARKKLDIARENGIIPPKDNKSCSNGE